MLYVSFWHQKDSARIFGIADVHIGSPKSRYKQLVEFLKENDDAFVIFLGDVIDNAIADSVSNVYEQTMSPERALFLFVELLKICEGRVLGVVSGNHEERTKKRVGVDLLSVVCEERGVPYSEDILIVDFQVGSGVSRGSKKRIQYTLVCGHGYSSARGIGAKITGNGRLIDVVVNGDVYLTAHTHQPSVVKFARFEADTRNKKILQREAYLVTVPSWLDYEHYAASKFMHPSAGGYVCVELSGTQKDIKITMGG
ncbi:MAG: metallophosphoesterase [Thermosphaera sp.]